MQIVKIKDGYVNFDNVTRVRVWTAPSGDRQAEIIFLTASDGEGEAAPQPLRLTGEEAEALVEWLDGQKMVDLSRLHRMR